MHVLECWSLFLINNFKATLLKRYSDKDVFLWILQNFSRSFVLKNICKQLLLSEFLTIDCCAIAQPIFLKFLFQKRKYKNNLKNCESRKKKKYKKICMYIYIYVCVCVCVCVFVCVCVCTYCVNTLYISHLLWMVASNLSLLHFHVSQKCFETPETCLTRRPVSFLWWMLPNTTSTDHILNQYYFRISLYGNTGFNISLVAVVAVFLAARWFYNWRTTH